MIIKYGQTLALPLHICTKVDQNYRNVKKKKKNKQLNMLVFILNCCISIRQIHHRKSNFIVNGNAVTASEKDVKLKFLLPVIQQITLT